MINLLNIDGFRRLSKYKYYNNYIIKRKNWWYPIWEISGRQELYSLNPVLIWNSQKKYQTYGRWYFSSSLDWFSYHIRLVIHPNFKSFILGLVDEYAFSATECRSKYLTKFSSLYRVWGGTVWLRNMRFWNWKCWKLPRLHSVLGWPLSNAQWYIINTVSSKAFVLCSRLQSHSLIFYQCWQWFVWMYELFLY